MILTRKVIVPHELSPILDRLTPAIWVCVRRMLQYREQSSSKYYPEIPCVISKSLITKYQKDEDIIRVKKLTIPICGDKGKQVKIVDGGIRIFSLFKENIIPCDLPINMILGGFIRGVEFFKRKYRGKQVWYMSYTYEVIKLIAINENFPNTMGVDRNSKGNVATVAVLQTGKVRKIGPCTKTITECQRKRRKNLQKHKNYKLLSKIRRKQKNRIRDINHKVSRTVVMFAWITKSVIVLEILDTIRKGKARRYVEKSQWSYYQLCTFIEYKAALLGIPVYYVPAQYTSKECSRCGYINVVNGKHFECKSCGHVDHRDANAAFNIAMRYDRTSGKPSVFTGSLIDDTPLVNPCN